MPEPLGDDDRPVLTYRSGAEDHPPTDLWRGWALARAWFYTVFFSSFLVLMIVLVIALARDGMEWEGLIGVSSATLLFGTMTVLSVRSLWMIYTRRAAHPFDSATKLDAGRRPS